MTLLYPELFKSLEAVRWNMATDVPCDEFDVARLSDEQMALVESYIDPGFWQAKLKAHAEEVAFIRAELAAAGC